MNTKQKPGLDVLSVGAGHIEIKFDEKDVVEVERAKRIIQDMLKRGYSLFIPVGDKGELQRVKRFIAKTGSYIIADGPTIAPTRLNAPGGLMSNSAESKPSVEEFVESVTKRGPGRPKKGEKIVSMHNVRATVVGRSAGG